jgi:hypothetical protein
MVVKRKGDIAFRRVIFAIITVPTDAFTAEQNGLRQTFDVHFSNHSENTLGVTILLFRSVLFIDKLERHTLIDDGLLLQRRAEVLGRNHDIGKDFIIRYPALNCSCLLRVNRRLLEAADVEALLKMKLILKAVTRDRNIEPLRRILRRTCPESVQTEAVFVILPEISFVFSAGIQLTINEFPVVTILIRVEVERDTSPTVNHFDGIVFKTRHRDHVTVPFACLID